MKIVLDKKLPVDIMIISEGTYPYVRGGVSSWIDQLMRGLKNFTFGIVFIGSRKEDYSEIQYQFPPNLLYLLEAYMFESKPAHNVHAHKGDKKALQKIETIHTWFRSPQNNFPEKLHDLDFYLKEVDEEFFLYSEKAWSFITALYEKNTPSMPFVDYFWTVRSIHTPIWILAKIAKKISGKAKVIHTPSTGYAGFLGTLVSQNDNIPLLLTEHGIYTKERRIDLLSGTLFQNSKVDLLKQSYEDDYIKQMWIRFFEGIGLFCYNRANPILSLYKGAQKMQIAYGAKEERCQVVPNGVDTQKLSEAYEKRPEDIPHVVTLIGRVVAIKDIKTFIRAVRIAVEEIPDLEGWIVGPMEEDPDYANECMQIVQNLDLQRNIKFLGFQNITDVLPKSGLLTLTSISEGMPLVILEGFAAGLPCVATDVGSCSELIEGALNAEDIAIGKAGEVVQIADASALAKAYTKLFKDTALWKKYQQNALKRVNTFYRQEQFLESYRKIYQEALQWQG
jgi:glycosyltransferase involved in cell wall biosynthesis